ncbi:MAG: tRNA (N6-isopentenyl adenosine(37)-C2)-methylthiotransferase MiaB [Bacteroidales bacterium]
MKEERKKVYIETYGCQMNVADSEVVASILTENGYHITEEIEKAGLILINTCSIRDNAEQRIFKRLKSLNHLKNRNKGLIIGLLGCMAERLREQILENEKLVDFAAGPDAYRDLPNLLAEAEAGHRAVNVILSAEETYADIRPVRMDNNGVTSFVSIMRGCDNMCAYCVVPFVRGTERSRDPQSVLREISELDAAGYREVTLLGQNVNSYRWNRNGKSMDFADLLEIAAGENPLMRIRFSTSHPRDISDKLLTIISGHGNICKHIHLPAQSGSSRILKLMNRGYSREWYLGRVEAIRRIIPECSISTDIISGFCTETQEDHHDTLSMMEQAAFDFAYMFKYSERPGTAAEKYGDDVPETTKTERLNEIISLQNRLSGNSKKQDVGKVLEVLAEGPSKRSLLHLSGRTSQNKVVVFPRGDAMPGDYVDVLIEKCTSATLIGRIISPGLA